MGIGIGSTSRAIVSLTPVGITLPVRSVASSTSAEKPGQLVRPEEAPDVQVGFGENTLSPSGAALKTLDSNLKAAAKLVPTVAELRERARAAQAQAQREEAAANETPPVDFRRRETVLPEPNPAVRNFFQDTPKPVDAAEASAPAPTAEAPEEAAAVQPSRPQPQVQPQPTPPGTRLNLQA